MKILMIANANNIWVHAFINHVISKEDELYLLDSGDIKEDYRETYHKRNVVLVGKIQTIHRVPKIGAILRRNNYCKEIRKLGHFDCCIILNTTNYRLSIWDRIKSLVDKTIVLYWGSDIHRVPQRDLFAQKRYLDNVDRIVFTAQNLQEAFMQIFPESYLAKLSVIHFGLDSLAYIDEICQRFTRNQIKAELSVPPDKKIVAIGYCGIPEQQHEKIINELSRLHSSIKSQICIMLQFMYNTEPAYRENIISVLEKEKMEYIIFNKFLSPYEIAKLRFSTDYFINAQTTDAIAGGVLESVYAGSKLISGKWLDYPELMKWGISYWKFDDFKSLNDKLVESIVAGDIDNRVGNQNLRNEMNWKLCRQRWHQLLDGEMLALTK